MELRLVDAVVYRRAGTPLRSAHDDALYVNEYVEK